MNVCVTVNSKYQRYLYIMLNSLYENNEKGQVHLFVVQRDFTDYDKRMIQDLSDKYGNMVDFIWVDEHKYDNIPVYSSGRTNLSLEIYFRLLLPEYLPRSIDRVLMLDVDIVVNKSLKELYEIDFDNCYFAAAPNMCHNFIVKKEWREWYEPGRKNWIHYNTGILMWNLKKIREDFPSEYIFNLAWKIPIKTATFEEEIFNVAFGESGIKEIPAEKWNYISTHENWYENPNFYKYNSISELRDKCHIIHFAALNPWQGGVKNDSFDLWWEWTKKTPYYVEILEECYKTCEKYVRTMDNNSIKQRKILVYVDLLMDKDFRKQIVERLENKGLKSVMIYGAGRVAKCLDNVLDNSPIKVECFIDKNRRWDICGKRTIGFEEITDFEEKTDAIVVSIPYYLDEIVNDLAEYTNLTVVSLDDLLREM